MAAGLLWFNGVWENKLLFEMPGLPLWRSGLLVCWIAAFTSIVWRCLGAGTKIALIALPEFATADHRGIQTAEKLVDWFVTDRLRPPALL